MGSLDDDGNAQRLQLGIDGVGNLSGHLLLDLQALRIGLNHTRQLGNSDNPTSWKIGYMRLADDWHYMMFAMALEGDGSKGRLRAQSKRRSSKFRGVPIGLGQSGRGDVANLLFNDKTNTERRSELSPARTQSVPSTVISPSCSRRTTTISPEPV